MKPITLLALGLLLFLGSPAKAGLVVNGDFETGDLTGWTDGGNTGWNSVSCDGGGAAGTSCYISNGAVGSFSLLSQSIPTVAGSLYDFSFYTQNDGGGIINALFDGVTVYSEAGVGHGWTLQSFTNLLATTGSTEIQFQLRDDPGFVGLDQVDVVGASGVPEPATGALSGLLLLGAAGAGLVRKLRRQN
jgi:hypothetical protein